MSILEAVDEVDHGLTCVFVACLGRYDAAFLGKLRCPVGVEWPAKYPHFTVQQVLEVVEGGRCGHRW